VPQAAATTGYQMELRSGSATKHEVLTAVVCELNFLPESPPGGIAISLVR